MDIPAVLLVHTVQVETYEGTGAYGDIFAATTPVACFVEDTRRVVRAPDGEEVVSESTVYAAPADAANLTEKSRITLPSGRTSIALLVKNHDDGGMGAPQHVEVACA